MTWKYFEYILQGPYYSYFSFQKTACLMLPVLRALCLCKSAFSQTLQLSTFSGGNNSTI